MNNLLQEMLYCEMLLTCETYGCREFFEFEEVASDPMEAWSINPPRSVDFRSCHLITWLYIYLHLPVLSIHASNQNPSFVPTDVG